MSVTIHLKTYNSCSSRLANVCSNKLEKNAILLVDLLMSVTINLETCNSRT